MPTIRTKRAYAPRAAGDGFRVLVDRLWPRGVTKRAAAVDLWARELAPSAALRVWFGHVPARFDAFAARYRRELEQPAARRLLDELRKRAATGQVTLVYGARDQVHNGAEVLRRLLSG